MRRTVISLSIQYDETETDHPAEWDWAELLDVNRSTISVVAIADESPGT